MISQGLEKNMMRTARKLGTYSAVAKWYKQSSESVVKDLSEALSSGSLDEVKMTVERAISELRFNIGAHERRIAEFETENPNEEII